MNHRAARVLITAAATALVCGGCSFGPKTAAIPTNLRITANFGTHTVTTTGLTIAKPPQTYLKALQQHAKVTTHAGTIKSQGPIIDSIDGSATAGNEHWFFYVNGVEPTKSAAAFTMNKGDHLWWDRHDAQVATRVPAVVGSFPEPFLDGLFGRRYPSVYECSAGMQAACKLITKQFTDYHIPFSPSGTGYGSGTDSLSVNVGTWDQIDSEVVTQLIAKGPGASGVYAHFTDGGHRLALENAAGRVVRTLGAGAGLVAATAGPSDVPTWVVTGTDAAGVMAAARAVTPSALAGHFALVVQGDHRYPVPVTGQS